MIYLPFKPIKGQEFTLYFDGSFSSTSAPAADWTAIVFYISKDGGTFTECTNAGNNITHDSSNTAGTRGRGYIVLTATEMDAGVVLVDILSGGSNSLINTIVIHTTVSELAASPTLNSSIADKITAIFQYLFFKRTVTATTETLKKSDGTTTLGTSTVSDDGTTFTHGAIS